MHAALISHLLIHMRSDPVARWVRTRVLLALVRGCTFCALVVPTGAKDVPLCCL